MVFSGNARACAVGLALAGLCVAAWAQTPVEPPVAPLARPAETAKPAEAAQPAVPLNLEALQPKDGCIVLRDGTVYLGKVVELTGGFELILPLMITAVTSHAMAEALGGRPIYEVLLERTLRAAGVAPPAEAETASSQVGVDTSSRDASRKA